MFRKGALGIAVGFVLIVAAVSAIVYFLAPPNLQFDIFWMPIIVSSALTFLISVTGVSLRDLVPSHTPTDAQIPGALPGSLLYQRNRRVMLQQVRDFWVKGVFEQSLFNPSLLELGVEHKPELVRRPWELIIKKPDTEDQVALRGKRVIALFDESSGALLILGEPGSGKTTILLELARDLISRAEQDQTLPMPVVIPLSSSARNACQ